MMYSINIDMPMLVKSQLIFKLKAYIHFFLMLIFIQAATLVISLGGLGGGSYGSAIVTIEKHTYSSALILIATFAVALGVAVSLASREARNTDFAFVSSRLTSNLSNACFLAIFCIFAGITFTLYTFALRVVAYSLNSSPLILKTGFYLPFHEMLIGLLSCILYLFLFSAVIYFTCNLLEFSKVTVVILPFFLVLVFVALRTAPNLAGKEILTSIGVFFFKESSLMIFTIKTLASSIVLFACGSFLTNRIEVRK